MFCRSSGLRIAFPSCAASLQIIKHKRQMSCGISLVSRCPSALIQIGRRPLCLPPLTNVHALTYLPLQPADLPLIPYLVASPTIPNILPLASTPSFGPALASVSVHWLCVYNYSSLALAVICRVCNQGVKKSAVLCEQCSLICHSKCSPNAPPTCDLRAQLLLYAQYAETGSPTGQYSDPMELLQALQASGPLSPTSDGSDVTPRTSLDTSYSPSPGPMSGAVHPPSAYKVLAAFKRSKSFLTEHSDRSSPAPSPSPSSPPPVERKQVSRKRSVLTKRKSDGKDRPLSISSASTSPNTSSMRSAMTAAESMASTQRGSTRSAATETEGPAEHSDSRFSRYSMLSSATTDHEEGRVPGDLSTSAPRSTRQRHRDSKSSSGGCSVQ